jgi:hypothetical protein
MVLIYKYLDAGVDCEVLDRAKPVTIEAAAATSLPVRQSGGSAICRAVSLPSIFEVARAAMTLVTPC